MDPMLIVSLLIGLPIIVAAGLLWTSETPGMDESRARWFL